MLLNSARVAAVATGITVLLGVQVGLGPSSAHAGVQVYCDGQLATIVGTDDREVIKGTDGPDVIASLAGNDTVRARGGDDVVCGGRGSDSLIGNMGHDRLFGEGFGDYITGKAGDDFVDGGVGDRVDSIDGGTGDDEVRGRGGEDFIRGDPGADLIVGGGSQRDQFYYVAARGEQRVTIDLRRAGPDDGGASDGPVGARDTLRGVEQVSSSSGDDKLYGDAKDNRLNPIFGEDLVVGRGGDDNIDVSRDEEADEVNCGPGTDTVTFDEGIDTFENCEIEIPR